MVDPLTPHASAILVLDTPALFMVRACATMVGERRRPAAAPNHDTDRASDTYICKFSKAIVPS